MPVAALTPVLESYDVCGMGKSAGYARQRAGTFPPAVYVGRNAFIPSEELEAIRRALIRGATDDDLRELVRQFVAARGQDLDQVVAQRASRSESFRRMGRASAARRRQAAAATGGAA
jgi:predicted DNA-binding transcriptional regulator AlpA